MEKIQVDIASGTIEIVPLSPSEIEAAQQAYAAENTPQKIQARLEAAVQRYMDERARSRGYDSVFTAATYAEEPAVAQFQLEGRAFRAWRSSVWGYCYAQLAAATATPPARAVPTADELLAELEANVPLSLP